MSKVTARTPSMKQVAELCTSDTVCYSPCWKQGKYADSVNS